MTASLLYSAEEEDLRSDVRAVLTRHSQPAAILSRIETDRPYDSELWAALIGQIGVAGLAIPESHGGAGASWCEVAIVAEELGRFVTPAPFLGSTVLATAALLKCAGEAKGDEAGSLLADLAAGRSTATLAVPVSTPAGSPCSIGIRADASGMLAGRVTSVADAMTADIVLVPGLAPSGIGLYAVEASAVSRQPVGSLDLTRPLSTLTFDDVRGRRIGGDGVGEALTAGAAVLASEQLGIAEHCLELTVEYLKSRYQFGRPVGSFQGLKHRLADLWTLVTQGRAVARYAVNCLSDRHPDSAVAVAVAQSHCSALAVRAAEECVQLHGGIGFTWEHPAHLFLARAKADAIAFGAADQHRAVLANLVDLPLS